MKLFLDLGFILSLLLLAVGIERVALRPHQRGRIQAFFEELTLKVDDLSPDTMAVRLGNAETVRLLAIVTYFWFCVIVIGTLTLSGIITKAFNVPTPNHDMLLARLYTSVTS